MRSANIGAILGALAGSTPGFIALVEGIGGFYNGQDSTAWGLAINGGLLGLWGALMGAAVGAVAGALGGVGAGLVYRLVHNRTKQILGRAVGVSGRSYSVGDKAHGAVGPALGSVTSTEIARKPGRRI